ncbi:MAG: CRISPR-associated helicase Cas3', partial [Desulfoplanes sp.]|nr:CRISPR-associated helicase Cas3' [Desulfoplanes sp.]
MNTMSYTEWFKTLTGFAPHAWQADIGNAQDCINRLTRIPTGFGKSAGVSGAWIYNRIIRHDPTWPRRLVWMLPMRVLVEQTMRDMQKALQTQNLIWDGQEPHSGKTGIHILMGGEDATDWRLYPEENAILIGTQDMLLSRALNRGYGAARGRWPMEYALLNTDCLWVMDEVQLMDVALITSVQLQAFRNDDAKAEKTFRPCKTWWMSATLRPEWMDSVDSHADLKELKNDMLTLPEKDRTGTLWNIPKRLEIQTIPTPKGTEGNLAEPILKRHMDATPGRYGRITLVVVNTVDTATEIHKKLLTLVQKQKIKAEIELVHSRFRGFERARWPDRFLAKEHCSPDADRIIVATQVVEAGVDISAINLITELAPWASLIQRFGRCARYGEQGNILVIDRELGDKTLPYQPQELLAAKEALELLDGKADLATLTSLEEMLETDNPELLSRLFPYEYIHLLTRREADELFDTSPDLTGADLDISRFIRSGDERDVSVFWVADIPEKEVPPANLQPTKDALCPVPVYKMKQWPLDKNKKLRAWRWDYLDGQWIPLKNGDAYPGMIICVESKTGGYSTQRGWTGEKPDTKTPPVPIVPGIETENADLAQDHEGESRKNHWRTIATHCSEVSEELSAILTTMGVGEDHLASVLSLAAELHDWGKVHPVFRSCMKDIPQGWEDINLAKAPTWIAPRDF